MAVIADILNTVDTAAMAVGQTAFQEVATAVVPVFRASAVLAIVLVGINLVVQAMPMTLRNGFSIIVRLSVAFGFLSTWTNFYPVYDVLTNAPSEIGAVILSSFNPDAGDLYSGLDRLYVQSLDVANNVSRSGGYISGALAGLLVFFVAALMATISVIVIGAAKIMIGVLIILGPVMIAATVFKQTAPLFDAYVKLTLGFAMVPMLTAAMAGVTMAIAVDVRPDQNASTIADIISFVVVMMLGTGLMGMVPTIAQSLAQTAVGLSGIASSADRGARGAGRAGGAAAAGFARGAAGRGAGSASTAGRAGHVAGGAARSGAALALSLAQRAVGKQ
jgi:type IV secretion system protein VirB6